jgi:hypothetical protein
MSGHDLVLKDVALYPVPGRTNEKYKNNSVRIASL